VKPFILNEAVYSGSRNSRTSSDCCKNIKYSRAALPPAQWMAVICPFIASISGENSMQPLKRHAGSCKKDETGRLTGQSRPYINLKRQFAQRLESGFGR
jgi:hypothetical protein